MRDPQYQHRFKNSFSISYPDFPSINKIARSFVLTQETGKHDILEIYYSQFNHVFFKAIKTGVPVEITWRNDKVSDKFIGYTIDASYVNAQQLNRDVKITCIGASYPLKNKKSKIWKNVTASEIAVDIAKTFKLKPMVTAHPVKFTQQSMVGHSYWEKLNELAKKIGYGVQVIGAELHFHPIDKMIDQFMTVIPTLAFKDPLQNTESNIVVPTLQYFEPTIGDYSERVDYSRSTNIVGGVDPLTGTPIRHETSSNTVGRKLRSTTKDPLFSSVETKTVVASSAMARAMSEGRAQLGRFTMTAKGVCQGDPRIAPWKTVEVNGTGEVTDGFWIVKKAEHVIHGDGRYVVEFTCMSDGTGSNKPSATRPSTAGPVPTRNVANELNTDVPKAPTTVKLAAATALVKQTEAGYKVTPRTWRGM